MWDWLSGLLNDPKSAAPIVGTVATILVQIAASRGWMLDPKTADSISLAIVALAGVTAASHAHVQHAETHADAHVEAAVSAAKIAAGVDGGAK